jgi:CBS domain-containing protein
LTEVRTVREVMTPDVVAVRAGDSVMHAASLMFGRQIGCVLVMAGAELVGIFTERDVVRALAEGEGTHGAEELVSDWMTAGPVVIGPEATLGEALDTMIAARFRHLPVVRDGAVEGIVSIRDLSRGIRE